MTRDELITEAERAWPGVKVRRADFERWLDARCPDADLSERAVDELYLACACAVQQPVALALFESRYMAELEPALERFGTAIADEARQLVRVKLFGPERAIAEYQGRGDLRGWLRVLAVRTALQLLRRQKGETAIESEEALGHIGSDIELEYLQRKYTHQLKGALQASFEKLEVRERNLLRQSLVDRLNIDQLGGLYRVNRVTAYRWLAAARERLVDLTRARLTAELQLSGAELDSVFRLVNSRVDLSLHRLFRGD